MMHVQLAGGISCYCRIFSYHAVCSGCLSSELGPTLSTLKEANLGTRLRVVNKICCGALSRQRKKTMIYERAAIVNHDLQKDLGTFHGCSSVATRKEPMAKTKQPEASS